jgi:hypothetical protein
MSSSLVCADDRRDGAGADLLAGPPPALAHHQLVARTFVVAGHLAHDHGLQQADLADGRHQLGQRVRVEVAARLQRVGRDAVQWQLGETRPRDRRSAGTSGTVRSLWDPSG